MSDLIIIGYPDETTAENVWAELVKLQHDYLVDLVPRPDRTARGVSRPVPAAFGLSKPEQPRSPRWPHCAGPRPSRRAEMSSAARVPTSQTAWTMNGSRC